MTDTKAHVKFVCVSRRMSWAEWQERVNDALLRTCEQACAALPAGSLYEIRSRTYNFGDNREFVFMPCVPGDPRPRGPLARPEPLDANDDDPDRYDPRRSGLWFHGTFEVPR